MTSVDWASTLIDVLIKKRHLHTHTHAMTMLYEDKSRDQDEASMSQGTQNVAQTTRS